MKVGPKLKADDVSNIKFLLTESNAFLKSVANIKPCIFSLSVNSKISSIALTASNIDFPFTYAFWVKVKNPIPPTHRPTRRPTRRSAVDRLPTDGRLDRILNFYRKSLRESHDLFSFCLWLGDHVVGDFKEMTITLIAWMITYSLNIAKAAFESTGFPRDLWAWSHYRPQVGRNSFYPWRW